MRATRPHGGRDQYGIGRKANSSRPESNRLSHPDSNFYSIRAFTLSIKSSLDYGECRNCENRKSRQGGLDRSSVKRPASGLLRLQERPSGLAPCWLKSRYCSADKCTTLSMGFHFHRRIGSRGSISARNRGIRFKRIIYAIRSNRLVATHLGNRTVVRGSISAAMVLSLVLFAMIGFSCMVGSQPGSHDWLWVGKGHFSDSRLSTGLGHALP